MENSALSIVFGLDELPQTAKKVAGLMQENIILVTGEMGAGKTTFIKTLCKVLGVIDEVSSPTFSLVNEYITSAGKTIYHFDFYRITNEEEALDIGIDEIFYSNHICLIEWPEKIPNLLPDKIGHINLSLKGEKRMLEFYPSKTNMLNR